MEKIPIRTVIEGQIRHVNHSQDGSSNFITCTYGDIITVNLPANMIYPWAQSLSLCDIPSKSIFCGNLIIGISQSLLQIYSDQAYREENMVFISLCDISRVIIQVDYLWSWHQETETGTWYHHTGGFLLCSMSSVYYLFQLSWEKI